jgi:hypothetical protein
MRMSIYLPAIWFIRAFIKAAVWETIAHVGGPKTKGGS